MNNIREKFEAWYQTQFSEIVDFSLFAPTSAYYKDDDIDEAWDVWQAATEQSQKEIAELKAREKVLVEVLRYVNKELIMYGYQYESKDSINVVLNEALANVRGEVK